MGTNLDSLISKAKDVRINSIPVGFAGIGAKLVQYIGRQRIRHEQIKYLKQFLSKGDALIEKTSLVLDEIVIGSLIKGELETKDRTLKDSYLLFLSKLDSADKSANGLYKDLNPKYLEIKTCFGQALLLVERISQASEKLTSAHKELIHLLDTKKKMMITKNIAVFDDEADQIADLIKQFQKSDK